MILEEVSNSVHITSDEKKYVKETNPYIIDALENFKDQKLGFMTHFGIFSQLGIVESWALSDEVAEDRWSQDSIDWTNIEEFKVQYRNLNKSFNPVRLEPEKIAEFVKSCGFSYFIIPTKHHDGFCLWDSAVTDYKVTNAECPYQKDIYHRFVKACNEKGLITGAYFSKADWSNLDYWETAKLNSELDRHPTYDTTKNPEKWQKFVDFTHTQIKEITDTGKIDILWLDAGWVRPGRNQDIDITKLAQIARRNNPSTIIVDRACGGVNENYITPEQTVPQTYLDVPWESCISLGPGFAYSYNDKYRNEYELGHLFNEVISKGGNLVLNVAFEPSGNFPKEASLILSKFSKWFKEHETIIKGSRPEAPYYKNRCGYIKNGGMSYIFKENDKDSIIEKFIFIESAPKDKKITLLMNKQEYNLESLYIGARLKISMPKNLIGHEAPICYVLRYE